MTTKIEIYGREIALAAGSIIRPDGWRLTGRLSESHWEKAAFLLSTNNGLQKFVSVNVSITGRTIQRNDGRSCLRVQIEFVQDGEPSTFSKGWLVLPE